MEYCAASENSTYCPEEFEEFFKQRRRWIPSSMANLLLLLQESKTLFTFNKQISIMFLVYQAALLISSVINPAVCILIVSGECVSDKCIQFMHLDLSWQISPSLIKRILIYLISNKDLTSKKLDRGSRYHRLGYWYPSGQ